MASSGLTTIKYKLRYKDGDRARDDGCRHVAKALVRGWEGLDNANLRVVQIKGGITNLLYRVDHMAAKAGDAYSQALVRIFGDKTELMIDREKDNATFQALSDRAFSPYLHGAFDNGRVEEWLESRPLEDEEMSQRSPIDIPSIVAPELAKMHCLDMPGDRESMMWSFLDNNYAMCMKINFDDQPDKAAALRALDLTRFGRELEWLKTQLPSAKNGHGAALLGDLRRATGPDAKGRLAAAEFLNDIVFSHNDLLSGNILMLKTPTADGAKVKIVDYEYGGRNYRAFDLANHFCEYMGFDFDLANYPDRHSQIHFFKAYTAVADTTGRLARLASTADRDAFFDEMQRRVDRFALASHFFWGYWALIQARESPIDFDFMGYGVKRLRSYYAHKAAFFGVDDAPASLRAFVWVPPEEREGGEDAAAAGAGAGAGDGDRRYTHDYDAKRGGDTDSDDGGGASGSGASGSGVAGVSTRAIAIGVVVVALAVGVALVARSR